MEQAIEQGGDGGGVAEQLAPVLDGPIRRQQRRGAFVAAHDDLQEILGGGVGQLAHAEVVDDQQRDGRELASMYSLRVPASVGLGELFEQDVRLAIEHAVALLDGGEADRLGQMALAGAGRPEKQRVLVLGDEARRWPARRRARDSSSC